MIRTLPIRVAPRPGEALDSWLDALAARSGAMLHDIVIAAGLPRSRGTGRFAPDFTTCLQDHEAQQLATATGVPVEQLHAMTLRRYSGHALVLAPGQRVVSRMSLWGRGTGSRYCPRCLAEQHGRWPLRWRLTWSMACTRHQVLLAHACPSCGKEPRSSGILYRQAVGHRCPTRIAGSKESMVQCRTDLTGTVVVALADDSPILQAQQWIDDLLALIEDDRAGEHRPHEVFKDLTVLAARLLMRARPGDFLDCGPEIDEARQRYGADPRYVPTDAAVLAGPLTRAVEIRRELNSANSACAIGELIDREVAQRGNVSPGDVKNYHRHATDALQQLIWQAMDRHLETDERVRYRTCSARPRIPTHDDADIVKRARSVPRLFWRNWTVLLLAPDSPNPRPLKHRTALATGLLLPGWPRQKYTRAVEILQGHGNLAMTYFLARIAALGKDGLATLCVIADYLDAHSAPIDYDRRRTLDGLQLLPADVWRDICHRTGTPPGGNDTRRATMQRLLYQRITGSDLHAVSGPLSIGQGTQASRQLAAAPFHLTRSLLAELDAHAMAHLRAHGIDEPVTWSPPLGIADDLDLPGRSFGILDTETAAELIREKRLAPLDAAPVLGVTLEHLRLAFETHPPETGAHDHQQKPPRGTRLSSLQRRKRAEELSPAFLHEHYVAAGKPARQIGRELDLSEPLVLAALHSAGIEPEHGRRAFVFDDGWLRAQYLEQRRTIADIAAELNITNGPVSRRLTAIGITIRPNATNKVLSTPLLDTVPPELRPAGLDQPGLARLRRFAAVAATGQSIRLAAGALGLDPNVLRVQIQRIERDLGHKLYIRKAGSPRGHKLVLTEQGRRVLELVLTTESIVLSASTTTEK
ncbi:MAG: LysR family transcriptional regulator [Catenulispora sp.]|nr:LysR family transcriptional regulator [Catenulispora sp.]NUR61428.1 LysR family transcriptional regulator [Catenulispora sp.]